MEVAFLTRAIAGVSRTVSGRLARGIVLAAVLPAQAAAQAYSSGTADLTRLSLEELLSIEVYSASKFTQKTTDAPSSVTVITADDIKTYGYRTLADILNSVRGMGVAYDRNYAYLGVRGSGRAGDFNSRVLLLVDGYRINDPIYDTAPIGTEFILDVDLIDRVEVVRGPGSSVYGSNAVFGVINVFTKRGRDIDGVEASGELASFGADKERLSYGRRYENGAELLLSASRYRSRGQDLYFSEFDTPADNDGMAEDMDGDRFRSFFGKFAFGAFTLTGGYSSRDKTVPTAPYETAFNDPALEITDGSAFVGFGYSGKLGTRWDLSANLFHGRYSSDGVYPYAGPPTLLNQDIVNGKWWGGEVRLYGQFDRHKVVVGGEYQDNTQQNQANFDVAPYALYLDDRRGSTREGLYVQDEITLRQGLLLNAGLRYDHYSLAGGAINPRLGLIWSPLDTTTLKFLYGTAFRAPNVYELFYASEGSQKANPDLEPEEITTLEFVIEHEIRPNFRVTADAYKNRISSSIVQIADPADGELVFVNGGQVDAHGIELEAERLWDSGARLRASYAWQISRDRTTGIGLVSSPRHLAKLNGSLPLWGDRLRTGLELQYTGSRKTLAGGSAGGHLLVNLTLLGERLAKNLEISASVYNLLDKRYSDPGGQEHLQDLIAQDGRSYRLKLNYRF